MATPIISLEVLPYIFLAKLETMETVEIVSLVGYALIRHLDITRLIIMIKLPRPRITHRYPSEETFEDLEPLETKQGEPLEMEQEGKQKSRGEERPMEEAQEFSIRKRKWEGYDADDENNEALSHYHIKGRKTYIIELSSEEKSDATKNDVAKDKNYRSVEEEDKKESIDLNRVPQKEENPFEDEGYPFKRLVPMQEEKALW